MATTETEEMTESRFDDVDVDSILAKMERRGPLTFSRKRCMYQAPEFVKRLSAEETVDEGTTVKFECKVVGFPKPLLTWFKDDEPIADNPRIQFEVGENGSYAIVIEKTTPDDEGPYRCLAKNAEGSCSSTVYLSVKAKYCPKKCHTRAVSLPPSFSTIHEKIDEEEKENTVINQQPKSPLSHIYENISLRTQKMWPKFLGRWAFAHTDSVEDDVNSSFEEVFPEEECSTNHVVNGYDESARDSHENVPNGGHHPSTSGVPVTTSDGQQDILTHSNDEAEQKAVKDLKNALQRQFNAMEHDAESTDGVTDDISCKRDKSPGPAGVVNEQSLEHVCKAALTGAVAKVCDTVRRVKTDKTQDQNERQIDGKTVRETTASRVSLTAPPSKGDNKLRRLSDSDTLVGSLRMWEILFALTGSTLAALQTGMAPHEFVLSILAALILCSLVCWLVR